MLTLREEVELQVATFGKRTPMGRVALQMLYKNPLISAKLLAATLAISQPTADALIYSFVKIVVLKEITGQQRHRLYAFDKYLRLFTK